jgi:hypothetical protein
MIRVLVRIIDELGGITFGCSYAIGAIIIDFGVI